VPVLQEGILAKPLRKNMTRFWSTSVRGQVPPQPKISCAQPLESQSSAKILGSSANLSYVVSQIYWLAVVFFWLTDQRFWLSYFADGFSFG
jgi:hypothetical protein